MSGERGASAPSLAASSGFTASQTSNAYACSRTYRSTVSRVSQSAIFRFKPCSVHHLGFADTPIPKVQGRGWHNSSSLGAAPRVGVTGDAYHKVDMIRHDRTRQELPAPVAGCLLKLTTDHLGLSAGQPDRVTGQLVPGDATKLRPAFVVGPARLVIPPLGSVALELRADEAVLRHRATRSRTSSRSRTRCDRSRSSPSRSPLSVK